MADEDIPDQEIDDEVDDEQEEEAGEEGSKLAQLQNKLKESIDVRVEDIGSLRKKLTISIPRQSIQEMLDEQYRDLRRDAVVPGFRRGRAPRRLLEKRFGQEIGETLIQQMVTTGFLAAVDKTQIKVIGDPQICVPHDKTGEQELVDVQEAVGRIKLPDQGDMSFSCEVEIRPEFELPNTEGIEISRPVISFTDEDIQEHIERLRSYRGEYEPQPDGQVQADDRVFVDMTMTCEGTTLQETQDLRLAARPQVVCDVSLENLGEILQGAKVGDTREATGRIGDEYAKVEFRGKEARFEFKIKRIERLRLPEVAEVVEWFGLEDEKELADFVRKDMESRTQSQIHRAMLGQIQRYLVEKTTFDLPENLSARQAARVAAGRMIQLYQQGVPPADVDKRLDEIRVGAREEAVRELKLLFIMEKLAESISVDVSEAEVNALIASIARNQGARFDRVRDQLIKDGSIENLVYQIRDDKILEQLLVKAKVTDVESPQKGEKAEGARPEGQFADET